MFVPLYLDLIYLYPYLMVEISPYIYEIFYFIVCILISFVCTLIPWFHSFVPLIKDLNFTIHIYNFLFHCLYLNPIYMYPYTLTSLICILVWWTIFYYTYFNKPNLLFSGKAKKWLGRGTRKNWIKYVCNLVVTNDSLCIHRKRFK